MSAPLGPAPGAPDDPELWEEWYEGGDAGPRRRFGWPVRILAILVVVALAVLMVMGG